MIEVVLYGIEGAQLRSIYDSLMLQAKLLGHKVKLVKVTDIDLLLKSNIYSIPAIEIDGKILLIGRRSLEVELQMILINSSKKRNDDN